MALTNSNAIPADAGTQRKHRDSLAEAVLQVIPRSVSAKGKIPADVKALKILQRHRVALHGLVDGYEQALERSRGTGVPVRFLVEVGPTEHHFLTKLVNGCEQEHSGKQPVADRHEDGSEELEQALASARERGRLRIAEILAGPEMLSADQLAARIGTTRVTVNAKRKRHQLLGLEGARRGIRFPAWQIGEDGKPFAALPVLFGLFGDSPWAVYRFLVQRHPELDGATARDALAAGNVEEVMALAATLATGSG